MNTEAPAETALKRISLVIFDMDGVIADTADGHRDAWTAYMARHGKVFTENDFKAIFGIGSRDFCPKLFPERILGEEDMRMITEEKETMFRQGARGQLKTFPGFLEFLDLCDRKGIPMTVGSSACRKNVDFVLKELGIARRFAATVSSDDVENAKPEPDIFLKAASMAGVSPEYALVVEDSLMGIAAARAAGMRVAGLATTHPADELRGADFVAGDFNDLKKLIGAALSAC